jgi:hypothetical protein
MGVTEIGTKNRNSQPSLQFSVPGVQLSRSAKAIVRSALEEQWEGVNQSTGVNMGETVYICELLRSVCRRGNLSCKCCQHVGDMS